MNWQRTRFLPGWMATGDRATYWAQRISAPSEPALWRLTIRFNQEGTAGPWDFYKTGKEAKAEAERLDAQ